MLLENADERIHLRVGHLRALPEWLGAVALRERPAKRANAQWRADSRPAYQALWAGGLRRICGGLPVGAMATVGAGSLRLWLRRDCARGLGAADAARAFRHDPCASGPGSGDQRDARALPVSPRAPIPSAVGGRGTRRGPVALAGWVDARGRRTPIVAGTRIAHGAHAAQRLAERARRGGVRELA